MLFGDKITFAPNIKNWWQAITIGAINTTAKIVEGALFGAMVGMGAGLLKGLTQLAMPTATSIGVNIIGSFGTLGSSVRAVFGIQNATHTWAMGNDLVSTETSEAFFDGAIPEYESIKRIGTGNAEPQDALMLLYLLHLKTPTPKEKPVTEEPIVEEPVKNNNITEPEPIKKKGDGEAFEAEPKELLKGEGDVGTYKELRKAGEIGDNVTPHHMPSDAYMKKNNISGYSRNEGVSMNMEQPHPGNGGRHRNTKTFNNNMTAAEKQAYFDKSPRDALAHDIKDARNIYKKDGLYNEKTRNGLQETIKQTKAKYPNTFNK